MTTNLFRDLLAWYKITPDDDLSGTAGGLKDHSGHNGHVTVSGTPTLCDGHDGTENGGVRFNGNSGYFTISPSFLAGDFSICLWMRPNVRANERDILSHHTGSSCYFRVMQCTSLPYYLNYVPGGYCIINNPVNDNEYNFYVFRRAGSAYEVLVDGVVVWSTTTAPGSPSGVFYVGRSYDGYYGTSDIDDLRVYTRCITDAEVREIMRGGEPTLRDGLVTWLPCVPSDEEGNALDGIRDYSGFGNHADSVGAVKTTDENGVNGHAISLKNGGNLDLPCIPAMQFPGDFTVTARINPEWFGGESTFFVDSSSPQLRMDGFTDNQFKIWHIAGGVTQILTIPGVVGESQMVSIQRQGTLLSLAIDAGVPTTGLCSDAAMPNSTKWVFGEWYSGGYATSAIWDDIRIYNRALSSAELTSLGEAPTFDFLTARWKMTELLTGVGGILDYSGSRLHATVKVGTPTLALGHDGTENAAISFPNGSYAEVPDSDLLHFGDRDWCICAWVGRPAGISSNAMAPIFGLGTDSSNFFTINFWGTSASAFLNQIYLYVGGTSQFYAYNSPSIDFSDEQRHHLAILRRGDAFEVWLDGETELNSVMDGSASFAGVTFPDFTSVQIAGNPQSTSYRGNIILEDLRVYTGYAPTQTEIQTIMLGDPAPTPTTLRYIDITNAPTVDGYQARVTVESLAGMSADFGNIRFYDESWNPLPYWRESYTESTTAEMWVKLPLDATRIIIDWSDADRTDASDGNAVFEIFDDFVEASLDSEVWDTVNASAVVADSVATVTVNSASGGVVSKTAIDSTTQGYLLEGRVAMLTAGNAESYFGFSPCGDETGWYGKYGVGVYKAGSGNFYATCYLEVTEIHPGDTAYHLMQCRLPAGSPKTVRARVDSDEWIAPATQSTVSLQYVWLHKGYISTTGQQAAIDWVRVRKYLATEPVLAISSEVPEAPSSLSATITVENPPGVDGFQASVIIPWATGMDRDFADLRFFDGETPIPYAFESVTRYVSATVWLKLPLNCAEVTMTYQNAGFTSESDPDTVFEKYDDFSGGAIDTEKWSGDTSSFAVSDGSLYPLANNKKIYFTLPDITGLVIEARMNTSVDGITDLCFGLTYRESWGQVILGRRHVSGGGYIRLWGDGSTYWSIVPPNWDSGVYAIDKIVPSTTLGASVHYYNGTLIGGVNKVGSPSLPSVNSVGIYNYGGNANQRVDWIRVRKYLATEPVLTANVTPGTPPGEPEEPETPIRVYGATLNTPLII